MWTGRRPGSSSWVPDLVVTVPKPIWLDWIDEGDPAGSGATGTEWGFWLGRSRPPIEAGDRLYIVAWGRLRGYSPVTRLAQDYETRRWVICRRGNASAVTIPETIPGFRGYRRVWWDRSSERSFPHWRLEGVAEGTIQRAHRAGILGTCLYCGEPRFLTRDHIVPVSAGGKAANNIFPVCWECNSAKAANSWPQWLTQVEDLDGLEQRIRAYARDTKKGLRWTLVAVNAERQRRTKVEQKRGQVNDEINKSELVQAIMTDCLYGPGEVKEEGQVPEGARLVEGIVHTFALHPRRLEKHREEVRWLLDEMGSEFHKSGGGGWSFLQLCNDKHGVQWTSFHAVMETLICLGIGLDMVEWCAPREVWSAMPGGMPYVVFDTSAREEPGGGSEKGEDGEAGGGPPVGLSDGHAENENRDGEQDGGQHGSDVIEPAAELNTHERGPEHPS